MQDQERDNSNKANEVPALSKASQSDFIRKIVDKIKSSENILVALSRDPSVDEIAAAIGLTIYLDSIQKHVTAIYSGRTPDAVAFLQPDDTFEKTTDSLRDFIVALDKNKADHLRYKLEGDFVKVFITPYKTKITEEDLDYSYGDYNVDFVIAIDVPAASNLDAALREYGRIMHDASAVNITIDQPGRFGEIEWSDQTASSLCEMVTELIFALQGSDEQPLEHDVATALLTGIVAATDRFSNERTNPNTLGIASKLMAMGADQQLITSNVDGNEVVHNEDLPVPSLNPYAEPENRRVNLTINHDEPELGRQDGPAMGGQGNVMPAGQGNAAFMNPAAQMAPTLNLSDSPVPTGVSNDINNIAPESVVVQPIIPNTNAQPAAGDAGMQSNSGNTGMQPAMPSNTPAAGQMQMPNQAQPNSATVGATNPQSSPVMSLPGVAVNPPVSNMAAAPGNVGSASQEFMHSPVMNAQPSGSAQDNTMHLPGVNNPVAAKAEPVSKSSAQAHVPSSAENTNVNAVRPMATAPAPQTQKQVGNTIQPPVVTKPEPKNYAEMLEAALAEDINEEKLTPNAATASAAPIENAPEAPTAPAASETSVTPVAEPVANPGGAILPPPPAPDAGNGMMPPVLPPVQVPSEMPK